jgi:hypothetical protein
MIFSGTENKKTVDFSGASVGRRIAKPLYKLFTILPLFDIEFLQILFKIFKKSSRVKNLKWMLPDIIF